MCGKRSQPTPAPHPAPALCPALPMPMSCPRSCPCPYDAHVHAHAHAHPMPRPMPRPCPGPAALCPPACTSAQPSPQPSPAPASQNQNGKAKAKTICDRESSSCENTPTGNPLSICFGLLEQKQKNKNYFRSGILLLYTHIFEGFPTRAISGPEPYTISRNPKPYNPTP